MKHPFLDRLAAGPIVADGGMGTMLYGQGVPPEHCYDELNLSNRRLVQDIHADYVRAGAELIETNTFSSNRYKLQQFGLEGKVHAINLRGAKLAREVREVTGESVFVAGAIGPTGRLFYPLGKINYREARTAFREQVLALLEGGVDLFVLETFHDVKELTEAIRAARETCQVPIVAMMTFTGEGHTLAGDKPVDLVSRIEDEGVDAIGVNCSLGSQQSLEIARELGRWAHVPLAVMPNAGFPGLVAGRFVYQATPEYFGRYATNFLGVGAKIIGGCCGTTPDHIRVLRKVLDRKGSHRDLGVPVPVALPVKAKPAVSKLVEDPFPHEFRKRLGKEFLVSVEIDPPKGLNPAKCIRGAMMLKEQGVDLVNVADSPLARAGMSNIALVSLIQRMVGIETLMHLTCRDRNLMGLQTTLLGVHALGIKNILAVTGDPPSLGEHPKSTGVFDVDSIGLVTIIEHLNRGVDLSGNSIGRPTQFLTGVGVNPMARETERELDHFRRKVEAGASFAFTQPLYDIDHLDAFLSSIKDLSIPIFLGILPLQSYRHAVFMHNEVPGISIPSRCRERMKKAGEKALFAGIEMARELLAEAREKVSGVYLMPSFGRYEQCAKVLEGMIERSGRVPDPAVSSDG